MVIYSITFCGGRIDSATSEEVIGRGPGYPSAVKCDAETLMQPQQPRRQFVKAAAAAIATTQFPILGANDRINVGIVGLGGRGTDHIGYYLSLDSESRI